MTKWKCGACSRTNDGNDRCQSKACLRDQITALEERVRQLEVDVAAWKSTAESYENPHLAAQALFTPDGNPIIWTRDFLTSGAKLTWNRLRDSL